MTTHRLVGRFGAAVALSLALGTIVAKAQTNSAHASSVGTWTLDVKQSDSGSEPMPQAATLTVVTDRPDELSWRLEVVADANNKVVFGWSGPKDGTLHPMKMDNGQIVGQQSARNDGDALIRHVEDADSVFDSRATMSADGNTITDEGVVKRKDGSTSKTKSVFHRVSAGK